MVSKIRTGNYYLDSDGYVVRITHISISRKWYDVSQLGSFKVNRHVIGTGNYSLIKDLGCNVKVVRLLLGDK